jgi:hypothetical protein
VLAHRQGIYPGRAETLMNGGVARPQSNAARTEVRAASSYRSPDYPPRPVEFVVVVPTVTGVPLGVVTVTVPVIDTVTVTGAGADVTVPRVMVAFTCCDWLFAGTPDVLSVRVQLGTVKTVPVVDVIDAVVELPEALSGIGTAEAPGCVYPDVVRQREFLHALRTVPVAWEP